MNPAGNVDPTQLPARRFQRVIIEASGDNMLRTQISLDPKMYARLKAEARRQGVSIAELMRRALVSSVGMGGEEHPWMRHAGAVASGDHAASRSVDDVVYGKGRP